MPHHNTFPSGDDVRYTAGTYPVGPAPSDADTIRAVSHQYDTIATTAAAIAIGAPKEHDAVPTHVERFLGDDGTVFETSTPGPMSAYDELKLFSQDDSRAVQLRGTRNPQSRVFVYPKLGSSPQARIDDDPWTIGKVGYHPSKPGEAVAGIYKLTAQPDGRKGVTTMVVGEREAVNGRKRYEDHQRYLAEM